LTILLFLFVSSFANASNVIDLTPSNFDQIVGQDKFALVEFFAPWCGHCQNLAQLADAFSHVKNRVVIAKVDADSHKDLGKRFDISGYPTLKWFNKGVINAPEDYGQGRDLESLASFVEQKSGVKSKIKKAETAVTVLTIQNFNEIVMDPSKNALVEFYAPWCGHCKNLAPTYEKVAQDYSREPNCIVANIDAVEFKDIAGKYDIKGYPTIKFFPKGENKTSIEYEGGRSEKDFIKFLNENCGTHRLVGGGLSEEVNKLIQRTLKIIKIIIWIIFKSNFFYFTFNVYIGW
jgi:protein disulfide-isomerase A6